MSKTDDLRAMREARYLANKARGAAPKKTPGKPAAPAAPSAPATASGSGSGSGDPASSGDRLCGHRAISGRTCTREHGHAAKSHRYS